MPKLTFNNSESINPLTGLPQQETILDFKVSKGPKITRSPIENSDSFSIPSNLMFLNSPYEDYEKSIGNTIYIGDEGPSQLDDYRAENTSWYKNFGNGLASRGLSIIPKTVEMGAAVGGMGKWLVNLLGVGDDPNFEDVYNNRIMQSMSQIDDNLKEQFPVYSSHYYNSDKFLDKIGTQKFWFEDGFDGLAFLGSAYLTGGATIGALTKAGLSRGMALGMGTLANTVGESAMEAKETYDTIYQQLLDAGVDSKTAKEKASKYAVNTFGANMLLLGPSNSWETKLLFGSASDGFLKTAQKMFKGELTKPEVGSILMGMGEGIGKEGLWEEGLQTAVQKWEQRRAKGEVDDSGLFGGYIEQWFKNWSDIEGQTSMFLGGIIGMGGGGISTYKENKQNKKTFEEAGKFVNNWKQQLQIGDNTFNDNYKNIYLKKEDGSFYLKPGDPIQNEDGSLTETQEPIENIDGLTKRALQINNDNHALETALSAVINNDEVAHTISKNDILSRKLFSYLSNPLFESTNEALEYFTKDTKEAVDKISQSETDETEKKVLLKGYNEALSFASQLKEKWDAINKTFGSSEDLFSDDLQKEFNIKVKKAILVNEVKKLSIEQIKDKQFAKILKSRLQDNTKFEDDLDALYNEAQESIDNFSNKKYRKTLFNEYKQDNLDKEDTEKQIKLLEIKKAKDGVLSEEDQDTLDKLKYDFNLNYYINGESYLNRIGGNTSREILLNDNFTRNTKLDRIGRKNNHYLNKGLDEKSYKDHLEVVDDYISQMDENPLYLLEAAKTLNSLLRQVQDPINSNIDEKRYSELTSKIGQIKDLLKQELRNIDQEILDNEDSLYDISEDGLLEERTDISDDERDEIEKNKTILENLKKEIQSYYDSLIKNPINTNSKESLINKNKVFADFDKARKNGKLDEFLEQEFIERYYVTAPLAYIEAFRLSPEEFDDINEINKLISDLNYITKIIKNKYPELYKQLMDIKNIFEKEIKPVVLKNSQQRLLVQKRNEINDKKNTWYQFGIVLDNTEDEFTLELFDNDVDSELLGEIKKIIGADIINEILRKASTENYDLAYFYSIINLLKEKDEKVLKNLKEIILKSKEFYIDSIINLDLNYSHKENPFKIKDSPSSTFNLYKNNPNLLLKDLLSDDFIKGIEVRNNKSEPNKYSPEQELWYNSPLYKFFQNNSTLSLLSSLKQKGYTGTSLNTNDLIKLLQLHLRYSSLFNLEEALSNDFDYGTFLSELKKVSNDFGIAPTYEQQLSLREIINWYSTDKTYAYMKGIAGAGKTNIVTKYAVKMMGLEPDQMIAFAHNEMASTNIKNSVNPTQETITLEKLYAEYKTLITDKTELLILDEVNANESNTLWKSSVLSLQSIILEINKQRKTENKKELKLFMLGDPTQITQEKSLYNNSLSVLESSKTLAPKVSAINPLTLSYRSDVSAINEVSKKFQDNPREVKSLKVNTTTPLGTPDIKGVYATTLKRNTKGILEEFDSQLTMSSTRSKLVIVLNEADKIKYNNLGIPNLTVLTFEEAQGTTFSEVYVDINKDEYLQQYLKNEDNAELEFNTGMYTSISRASEFVMFLDNSSSFINEVDSTISDINTELKKEKEDNKTLLNETINKSLNILGIKPEEVTEETKEKVAEDKETEIKDEDIVDTNTVEDTDPIIEPVELITPSEETIKTEITIDEIEAYIERRRQELESSREIETLYDLRNPIAEDSKEIISKIEEANKLRKNAQEKSEQAVKETDEEKIIALNSDANNLNEKARILDKEVKKSRDSVINDTQIKQAINSAKILGQRLLNKIKLAAKSNEWISSMPISEEEFAKLEDAIKRLSVKDMGEVTSNSEVIPDILLIEEINAKYDEELATLEETSGVSGSALKDVPTSLRGVKYSDIVIGDKHLEDILDENKLSDAEKDQVREIFSRGVDYFKFDKEGEQKFQEKFSNPEDITDVADIMTGVSAAQQSAFNFHNTKNYDNVKDAVNYIASNPNDYSPKVVKAVKEIKEKLDNPSSSMNRLYAIDVMKELGIKATITITPIEDKSSFTVEVNAPQFGTITSNFDPVLNQSRLVETSEGIKFVPLVQKGTKVHYILSRKSISDNTLVVKTVGRRTEVEDKKHVVLNSGNYYEVVGVTYLDSLNPTNPFENYLLEQASKIENVDVLFDKNKSEEVADIENNPNILISGEISAVQQQTFVYGDKNITQEELEKEGGLKEYILKKAYKLLADKHTLDSETTFYKDAKVSNFRVKIFKRNDTFKKLTPDGLNSEKYAGYPYAIFDISFKDKSGTIRQDTRFVRLDPRRLNTEDSLYKTIVRYRNAINEIEDAFINEKVFTKDLEKFGLSNIIFNKILAEFRRDFTSQFDGKDYKGADKFNVVPKDVPTVIKEDIENILEESGETNTNKISDDLFSLLQKTSKDIIPLTYKAKKVSQKTSLRGYLAYLESQIGESITEEDYNNIKQYYDKLYETGIINEDNTNFGKSDKYLIDFAKRTSLTQSELKVLFNMSKTFFIAENQYEEALLGTKNVIKQLASQGVLNSEASTGVMTEDARTYLNSVYHKIRTFRAAVGAMSFIPKYIKDKDGNLIKDETKHYGWDPLTGKVKVYPIVPDDRFVSSDSEDLELVKLTSGEGQINKALNNLVQANFTKKITINPETGEKIVDNPLRLVKYLPSGRAYVAPTVLSYSDDINYQYLKYIRETFNNYIDTLDPKNRQFDELKDEHGIKFQTLERYTESWPGKLRKELQLENEETRKKIVTFLLDKKVITVEELNEHINSIPKRRITSEDLNQIAESIEKSELRFPLNRFKLDDLSKQASMVDSTNASEQKEGKEALKELESLLVTNLQDIKPTRVQVKIDNKGEFSKKIESTPVTEEKPIEKPKTKGRPKKVYERRTLIQDGQYSVDQMEDGSFTVFDEGEFPQGINYRNEKQAMEKFKKFINSKSDPEIKENDVESTEFDLTNLEIGNLAFEDITPGDSIVLTEWDNGEIQQQLEEEEGKKDKEACD